MQPDKNDKPKVVHHNPCNKTLGMGPDGLLIKLPKKKFANHDQAVEAAKHMNAMGTSTYKLVAYKCSECHLYHIGRNETLLSTKLVKKLRAEGYGRPIMEQLRGV
jgi:hypothetical protein